MAVIRGSDAPDDDLSGGDENDMIFGLAGADSLSGNSGNDRLFGGADGDLIRGGAGNDRIDGGTGNDLIDGGWGNDILTGGEGADSFYFGGRSGRDIVTDFQQDSEQQSGDTIDLVGLGLSFEDLDIRVKNDEVRIDTGQGKIVLKDFTGTLTDADFDFGAPAGSTASADFLL